MEKPFAPSAERNRHSILAALTQHLDPGNTVLEIGSGTGQHLSWFAEQRSDVIWQPSDLLDKQAGIKAWVAESETRAANLLPPLTLDVELDLWPIDTAQVCYTANTLHIMSWSAVVALFDGVSRVLRNGGKLCVYGPFKIDGTHTGAGNARFDEDLRAGGSHSGIRDLTLVDKLAHQHGFLAGTRIAMPSNNLLVIWETAGSLPAA